MIRIASVSGHTFVASALARGSRVLDLGANHGAFARVLSSTYGASVTAVEPVPSLADSLEKMGSFSVLKCAVGNGDDIEITEYANTCASQFDRPDTPLRTHRVQSVSLEGLISRTGNCRIDLLKVDIEGTEIGMFAAASDEVLSQVDQITIEFHDFLFPETHSVVEQIKRRLVNIGFQEFSFSLDNTDVLFVRNSSGIVSPIESFYIRYVIKYVRGISRIARRWLRVV